MALKDSSGRITIDENAAQQDVQRIQQAISALKDSRKAIENIIIQASNEQGQTAVAIVEKATELKNQINNMIGRLNDTSSFISNTITHYQEVDRLVKEAIQTSMATSAALTSAANAAKSTNQVTAQQSAPKQSTSSKTSTSSNKSSTKKSGKNDIGDFVDSAVDSIANVFKKYF